MPRGKYSNPYAQLGNSAADIVNSFINRKGLESSGYLSASKQMADIDNTRAGTGKILQELAGNERANNLTAGDWNAARGGDFGQQMAISQTAGGQSSMTSILDALQGVQGGQGADGNALGGDYNSLLGKGDMPVYLNALNSGATEEQAIAAVVRYHTDLKEKDLLPAMLQGNPMAVMDFLGSSPEEFGYNSAGYSAGYRTGKKDYRSGRSAPKKYKFDPSTGLIPR